MPKLYAINKIIMPDDTIVEPRRVFDATVEQAKQFDKLKAARPATKEEIDAEKERAAVEDGTAFFTEDQVRAAEVPNAVELPVSGADNDPNGKPKATRA